MSTLRAGTSLQSIVIKHIGGRNALENYKRVSTYRNLLPLVHIWPSIILAFFLSSKALESELSLLRLLVPLISSLFVATRINALSVFVHEGAHYLVFPSKRINDVIVNLFSAFWILNDVGSYRKVHFKHHLHLLKAEDPDMALYSLDRSKNELLSKFVKDFAFISALTRIIQYLRLASSSNCSKRDSIINLAFSLAKLLFQFAVYLSLLAFLDHKAVPAFILFIFIWIVPLFGIFPAITRIKTISEHLPVQNNFNPLEDAFVSRSTFLDKSPFWEFFQTYFIGCGMDYHFEHHLFPDVPSYNLRQMHISLLRFSHFFHKKDFTDFANRSYVDFFKCYYSSLDNDEIGFKNV